MIPVEQLTQQQRIQAEALFGGPLPDNAMIDEKRLPSILVLKSVSLDEIANRGLPNIEVSYNQSHQLYTQTLTQAEIDAVIAVRPPHWANYRLTNLAMHLQDPAWSQALLNWFATHVFNCKCWRCVALKEQNRALTSHDFYLRYLADMLYSNSQVMLN